MCKIDGSSASGRAAGAWHFFNVRIEVVIDRQFFPRPDIANGQVEDMPSNDAGRQIRLTAVIDILRAGAVHRSINRPVFIQREQIIQLPARHASLFHAG